MDRKPQVSAKETYVLDEDELEKLDELSLTSVVREVSDSVDESEKEPRETPYEGGDASVAGNTTINELLANPVSSSNRDSDEADRRKPSVDLLDPELLFPDEPSEGGA